MYVCMYVCMYVHNMYHTYVWNVWYRTYLEREEEGDHAIDGRDDERR